MQLNTALLFHLVMKLPRFLQTFLIAGSVERKQVNFPFDVNVCTLHAMQAAGQQVQLLLYGTVKKASGRYVIGHRALASAWARLARIGKIPDWHRFSDFCSRTAQQFLFVHDDSVGAEDEGKDMETQYHAEVLIMLFHDLMGITIQPQELHAYLESNISSQSSDTGGVDSSDPASSSTSAYLSSEDGALDSDGSKASTLCSRRKRMQQQRQIYHALERDPSEKAKS